MSARLPLKVLILEDQPADAELMVDELRQSGFDPDWQRVQTKAEYLAHLEPALDVILADHNLPQFDGLTALTLLQASRLDIPFILVSGSIGEERAVAAMKQGAADYLLKDRLTRLGTAVANALEARRLRDQQRQAEALLRESEVRYRTLVEQTSDGIFISNSEGRYIQVNSAGCLLLGYTREEILEKTISDLTRVDPNQPLRLDELRQGKTLITNREMIRKDGTLVPVEISAKQLSDGGFQGIVRDITERKRAENELRKLHTAVEQSGSSVIITDLQGTIEYANPKFTEVTGYDADEVIGKNPRILKSGETSPEAYKQLWETLKAGGTWHGEFHNRKKNGELFWELASISPIIDSEGQVINFIAVKEDITEYKRTEDVLKASELRYRRLFEAAKDGILILDASTGRVVDVNPFLLDLLGYSQEEILGKELWEIGSFRDIVASKSAFQELQDRGYIRYEDLPLETRTGQQIQVEFVSNVYVVNDQKVIQCNIRDVTERTQATEALRQSETALKKAQQVAHVGSWAWYVQLNRLEWSDEMFHIFGIDKETFKGDLSEVIKLAIHPDDRLAVESSNASVINDSTPVPLEYRVVWPDGTVRVVWAEAGELVQDGAGNSAILSGIVQDITERKRAEENLRKLNRTLALLSEVNQTIVRIRSTSALFDEICRIAVEIGGFRTAWVGLLDPETRRVNPVAHAGITGDYLKKLDIVLSNEKRGNGPTARAIRTGHYVIVNDIEHDPSMAPWRDDALKLGYRAVASFPLRVAGEVRGTFGLYADAPKFFDNDELTLLDEMAGDIAFAMEFAEHESQRRQAEIALKQHVRAVEEMQIFLQTTLDAFPANTVVLAPDGTIINVNAGWIRFAGENNGASPMHYLGVNYLTVSDTADGDWSEEAASTAAGIRAVIDASQDGFYLEYPCHSPTERRWFALRVTPFPEPAPRRVVVAHVNITERRLAEEAEYEQRCFAEALRDSLAALTASLDVDTVMHQILNNAAQVVPYESASIIQFEGDTARASYLSGFSPEAEAFFKAFQYHKPYPEHLARIENNQPYLIADTRLITDWINIPLTAQVRSSIGVPIIMTDGLQGMLSIDSSTPNRYTPDDVERLKIFARYAAIALENAYHALHLEQKVLERTADLQTAKEQVELILSNSADAILLLQQDFTIQQTNTSFNEMFDCEQDDYFGQPITALVELNAGDVLSTILKNPLAHRKVSVDVEARRKNGTLFAVELSLASIRDDGFVCTVHDISQRKQVEQSLRTAVEKEQELNELKTRFVSMASHEFRTPLAAIHAATETLSVYRQKLTDDQIDQKLSNIRGQVGHLKDIMDDVMKLARLQARRFEFNPERVDLDALCQEIIAEFQSRPDITHNLLYTCDSPLPAAQLDIKLMRQLINNLVSNAIKYAPENKTVQIKLECTGNSLLLTVQDGGIGIPEADLTHLFEPFHRGANVGTIHGTGLGLVIAKESVDLHGGTIAVESQMGTGTTFTIQIPIAVQGE